MAIADLSPAARAVLDAYETSYTESGLVAALRAAASQLTSAKSSNAIRAIAAELEQLDDSEAS